MATDGTPGTWQQSGSEGQHLETVELRLYVAGQSPKSVLAIDNLRWVSSQYLPQGRYTIEVIDLLEHPKLANVDEIIAVPTLVRRLPEPIQKFFGDLSDTEKVLVWLKVRSAGQE